MADINSQLPAKITDGTLTATIRDVTGANDALNVAITKSDGTQVDTFGGGTQYTEDAASAGGESLMLAGAVRRDAAASSAGTDGDYATINTDAAGKVWVHASLASGDVASGAFAAGSIVAGAVAAGAGSFVKLEDVASADADAGVPVMAVRKATPANTSGTDGDYEFLQMSAGRLWASATIDAALPAGTNAIGKLAANNAVDIGDVTINNTEATPVPVYITSGAVSGSEVNDYDTDAAVAAAASGNHDYTVVATMLLKQIHASSSGRMKVTLQVGPVGALVTKGVFFNSTANPNIDITFAQPLEVPNTSTGTVRLIRTNLEAVPQDVYSTIIGSDL